MDDLGVVEQVGLACPLCMIHGEHAGNPEACRKSYGRSGCLLVGTKIICGRVPGTVAIGPEHGTSWCACTGQECKAADG